MDKFEKSRKAEIIGFVIASIIVGSLFGFVAAMTLWDFIEDKILIGIVKTTGVNPSLFVMLLICILTIPGIIIFVLNWKRKNKLLFFVAITMISMGINTICIWVEHDFKIDMGKLSYEHQEQYIQYLSEKEGYTYIGDVKGYEVDKEKHKENFSLFVKNIAGHNYYYCVIKYDYYISENFLLLERYSSNEGICNTNYEKYLITFDFDWDNDNASRARESIDEDDYTSNKKNEPEVIIVEHQVNTQPVEEWGPCNVCKGSGMCPTCNGTGWLYNDYCPVCLGRKVCQMCWGRRGGYFKVER